MLTQVQHLATLEHVFYALLIANVVLAALLLAGRVYRDIAR